MGLANRNAPPAAHRGTLAVGTDNWIGYFPLCSTPMAKRMRKAGWVLRCENDNADYRARFQRLESGEIQFAVATVDSYLLSGAPLDFPGTIIAVIDESKGGDAIVARREVAASLDGLHQASEIEVAFTPASPSGRRTSPRNCPAGSGSGRPLPGPW